MQSEYVLFNLLIVGGPLLLSFDRRVHFIRYWKPVLISIVSTAFLFLTWDILVSGHHWHFNPRFTLGFRLLGLPLGEWLFFLTVPYAVLFVWEVLNSYWPKLFRENQVYLQWHGIIWLSLAIPALMSGKTYTTLMLVALGGSLLVDRFLNTGIFQRPGSFIYFLLATIMIFIFNGYLTVRPVVLYDSAYQLDWRIFTIPIEDFGYGYAHILLTTIIYEKLRRRNA
ncbi:MAG: hypothetical protein Kow0037_29090 [Calditrichia bacterium]